MNVDLDLERSPHGGAPDHDLLDFSATTNPDRPPGLVPVYDSAFIDSRRYPADDYLRYRKAAGAYAGCEPRSVIPTAGSLQAFRLALAVSVEDGDTILAPQPSCGELAREMHLSGATPEYVPYDSILDTDPSPHAAVVICNPNNPTGKAYDADRLRAFADDCRSVGTTLIVDEAFIDFTVQPSLAGTDGVIVTRSLARIFGLPGLRSGFAVATGELRERLEVVRPAYGLSTPAVDIGVHCMNQPDFVTDTRRRVRQERERMHTTLSEWFDVYPSSAPYLLLDVGDRDVSEVCSAVREHGILVRDATTFRGLDSHVRVSVKRPAQNDLLLDALSEV